MNAFLLSEMPGICLKSTHVRSSPFWCFPGLVFVLFSFRVLCNTPFTHVILCGYVCIPPETINFWKAWDIASISLIFHVVRVMPCPGSGEH